jgi:hypothetical protein
MKRKEVCKLEYLDPRRRKYQEAGENCKRGAS